MQMDICATQQRQIINAAIDVMPTKQQGAVIAASL